MHLGSVLLVPSCRSPKKKRKEKTMPFGVNLMKSQISYQVAQESTRNIFHAQAALCWLYWRQSSGHLKKCLVPFTEPAFKMVCRQILTEGSRGQDKAGQFGAGRAGQGRAGQGRAGQGRAGRGRAGQGRARQGRMVQGSAQQHRAKQSKMQNRASPLDQQQSHEVQRLPASCC